MMFHISIIAAGGSEKVLFLRRKVKEWCRILINDELIKKKSKLDIKLIFFVDYFGIEVFLLELKILSVIEIRLRD